MASWPRAGSCAAPTILLLELLSLFQLRAGGLVRRPSTMQVSMLPLSSPEAFDGWLRGAVANASQNDREFQRRVAIRELEREHKEELRRLRGTAAAAKAAFMVSASKASISALEQQKKSLVAAVASMQKLLLRGEEVLSDKDAAKQERVRVMLLPEKEAALSAVEDQLEQQCNESGEYAAYTRTEAALRAFENSIGLTDLEAARKQAQKEVGRGHTVAGARFEVRVAEYIEESLLPTLAEKHGTTVEDLCVVPNVTMGMGGPDGATGEIDICVCRWSEGGKEEPVDVLAVLEVKRNAEDIGTAFSKYQQTLRWLAGARDSYDPSEWRSKAHPSGHFERTYVHHMNGDRLQRISFGPASFQRFWDDAVPVPDVAEYTYRKYQHAEQEDGAHGEMLVLHSLFFATRAKDVIDFPSSVLRTILHRVAAESRFTEALDDGDAIEDLRTSVLTEMRDAFTTSGVMGLYAKYAPHNLVMVPQDT